MLQNALKKLGLTVVPATIAEVEANEKYASLGIAEKVAIRKAIASASVVKEAEAPAEAPADVEVGKTSFDTIYLGDKVRLFGTNPSDKTSAKGNARHEYAQVVIRFIPCFDKMELVHPDECAIRWKAIKGESFMKKTEDRFGNAVERVDIDKLDFRMYCDMSKAGSPKEWAESIQVDVEGERYSLLEYVTDMVAPHISECGTFLLKLGANGRLVLKASCTANKVKPFAL